MKLCLNCREKLQDCVCALTYEEADDEFGDWMDGDQHR